MIYILIYNYNMCELIDHNNIFKNILILILKAITKKYLMKNIK